MAVLGPHDRAGDLPEVLAAEVGTEQRALLSLQKAFQEDSLFKGLIVLVSQSERCGQRPRQEAEQLVRASNTTPKRLDLLF